MPLLNYTTSVPASRSIEEISKMLAKAGARQIMHDYDSNGNIQALSFSIEHKGRPMGFRLPTDWRQIQLVLKAQRKGNTRVNVEDAQALRVAWRITKDWVEAQLAMLETQTVTTSQLFLPYAIGRDGRTLFEQIDENPSLLLGDAN